MEKKTALVIAVCFIPFAFTSQAENEWVVEEVEVVGNDWTKSEIVLREFGFRPGEALEEDDLLDLLLVGQERLERLSLFTEVFLDQEIISEGKIKIIIEVRERWNLELAPAGSYYLQGDELKARGFLHLRDRNFLGYGQKLDLKVHYLADYGLEVSWLEPSLASSPWILELEGVYLLGSYQDQIDRYGGAVGLGYGFAPDLKIGSSFRYQGVKQKEVQALAPVAALHPYLRWGHAERPDSRERFWNLLALEGEFASTILGGSEDYAKLEVGYSFYRDLLLQIVAALSLAAGIGFGEVPSYELFTNQVRGWDAQDAVGDLSLDLSSELRVPVPLYQFLQIVFFLDMGAIGARDRISLDDTSVGGGVGLRWFNLLQDPLRLDIGWGKGAKLHLGLGQGF